MDEATGDKEKLLTDQIKLERYKYEYARFSKMSGLRTEGERAQVAGFGRKSAKRAKTAAEEYYKVWSKSTGVNDTIKTLANYYDIKYNNSPRYGLLRKYVQSVDSGKLSPMSGFGLYEEYYNRIQDEVVGLTTRKTKITGQSQHFLERVFGCMKDPKTQKPRNGAALDDVIDCLRNPVSIDDIKTDKNGERSFVVIGHRAKVSIDPDTGVLIQTNPWRC